MRAGVGGRAAGVAPVASLSLVAPTSPPRCSVVDVVDQSRLRFTRWCDSAATCGFRCVGLLLPVGIALNVDQVAVLSEAVDGRVDGASAVEDLAPVLVSICFGQFYCHRPGHDVAFESHLRRHTQPDRKVLLMAVLKPGKPGADPNAASPVGRRGTGRKAPIIGMGGRHGD